MAINPDPDSQTMKKILILTQARMQSTRLPGKILLEVAGKPLLAWHIHRLQESGLPVAVATTVLPADEPIVEWCGAEGIPCFRGDEQDVLSRFAGAADQLDAEVIVRVTSDCPLIDGQVIRRGVEAWLALGDEMAYLSNTLERSWPRGFDFEIFSAVALHHAHQYADSQGQREHVTPYIWRDHPELFATHPFTRPDNAAQFRLTVDTPEDFELIRILFEKYGAGSMNDASIIAIMEAHPELATINAEIEQKKTQQ